MKTTYVLFVLMVASLVLLTACGGGAAPPEPAPAEQQPVVEPAEPAAPTAQPPTAAAVEPPPQTEAPQPQYAPFCEATTTTSCEAPTVKMLDNKYCIEKVPYAIMDVPAGTTYESQDPDMACVDETVGDEMRGTCHSVTSKQLWSYDLKVCNGACSATPSLQMGTDQCPEGYGFDAASQCCAAPEPASEAGCVIYQVDIGACPDPQ